jgi:hypothetical protein
MTTELRGSTPQGLARLLLLLMEEERRGPVPPAPQDIEEAKQCAKRAIAEDRFQKMANYAARGRRFRRLSDAKLLKVWTTAYDKMDDGPADDVAQERLTSMPNAEFGGWSRRTKSGWSGDEREIKQSAENDRSRDRRGIGAL